MEKFDTTPQEDPAVAYRKKAFAQQASKTIDTMKTSSSEVVNNPDGSVGLRVTKVESPVNKPKESAHQSNPEIAPEKSSDPVTSFLQEKGFKGDPKLDYSVVVKAGNGVSGTIHFNNFDQVKKFISENPDKISLKPGESPYKMDYNKSVYEWSANLSPEDKEKLAASWDEMGLKMMDEVGVENLSEASTPENTTSKKDERHENNNPENPTETKKSDKDRIDGIREELGMSPGPESAKAESQKKESIPTPEKSTGIESPEVRFKKYKNYEAHQRSAEKIVKSLQEARNFEAKNDTENTLKLFENTLANMTERAEDQDIEKLKGVPIDLEKEKKEFGIGDDAVDDYKRLRELQNVLAEGKSVKEVADKLEKDLSDEYGVERVDLKDVKTLKTLNSMQVGVKLSAEATEDSNLVGQIKQISGIGYHIPNVPVYNIDGKKIINTVNRDIKAGPSVVAYRAK